MGRVFLGLSPGFRLVAVKIIRPEHVDNPGFRARFRYEVAVARQVSGMYTPPVLDADPDGTPPWLATTYVPAPSLGEVVRDSAVMGIDALRALGAGLAEALAAVHRAGIVHRDLKPGNVLVAADGPRVIDFGIAKAFGADGPAVTGGVVGTPGYMAPEQLVLGGAVGPATDVFALGCVLTFAATGVNPFGSGDYEEVLRRTTHDGPRLDGVPDGLRPLVASCLDKVAGRRPSVEAVLGELSPAEPAHLLSPRVREALARRAEEAVALARPAPDATPGPVGRPGLGRRGFLGVAAATGAVLGVATVGGVRLFAERATASPLPAASGSTATPVPTAGPAPVPRWRHDVPQVIDTVVLPGTLARLGGTLVVWNETSALGFDAMTGNPTWTYTNTGSALFPLWFGVFGQTLLGLSAVADLRVIGLNAAGTITMNVPVAKAINQAGADLGRFNYASLGMAGSVAVLVVVDALNANPSAPSTVVAVDLVSGDALWHRTVTWGFWEVDSESHGGPAKGGVVDEHHCYLQDGARTIALDVRAGTVRWVAQNTVPTDAGVPPELLSDGQTVIVAGNSLLGLDAASGAQLWTTSAVGLDALGGLIVGNGRIYRQGNKHDVYALDSRSGKTIWHTANPVPGTGESVLSSYLMPSVSSSFIAVPLWGDTSGVVVLSAADGKPLWAYRDPVATGRAWAVLASTDTVYGNSGSALYAFPARA